MNTTTDRDFDLAPPPGVKEAPELISGKTFPLTAPVKVRPRSTVVLYFGE